MCGYVRRVCYIPAQKLYTQTNKLRARICTDMYGEFAISRHRHYTPAQQITGTDMYGEFAISRLKNYTPRQTNYGAGGNRFSAKRFFFRY